MDSTSSGLLATCFILTPRSFPLCSEGFVFEGNCFRAGILFGWPNTRISQRFRSAPLHVSTHQTLQRRSLSDSVTPLLNHPKPSQPSKGFRVQMTPPPGLEGFSLIFPSTDRFIGTYRPEARERHPVRGNPAHGGDRFAARGERFGALLFGWGGRTQWYGIDNAACHGVAWKILSLACRTLHQKKELPANQ